MQAEQPAPDDDHGEATGDGDEHFQRPHQDAGSAQGALEEGVQSPRRGAAGDGPPLVFLHGVAGLPSWPDWLDAFAADHRVVAPVLPGFGDSTGLDELTDFLDLTLYHLDLFDTLGVQQPILVGHSLGGAIAAGGL